MKKQFDLVLLPSGLFSMRIWQDSFGSLLLLQAGTTSQMWIEFQVYNIV